MTIDNFKKVYKYGGLKGLLFKIFYNTINKIIYFESIKTMSLKLKDIDPKYLSKIDKNFELKVLTPDEIIGFSENPNYQLSKEFVNLSIKNSDTCVAIISNNELASYGWYSKKPTAISDDFNINFSSDWVYMHRGYTNPKFRGNRLHAIGMAYATKYFSEKGFKGLISIVDSKNSSSLNSVVRLGYRLTGNFYLLAKFNRFISIHDLYAHKTPIWVTPIKNSLKFSAINAPI